ncbi:hypothetical protein BZG36_01327 [Bifiguratus adelaidae]|uniref:Pentatricopeptide repeat-containing protein-mitochondrial domain-containing protein n=1 Tax=Bifiguratus adelaidae TaxID=1938954 RepID=A0A261Y5K9_9FUNG|nr:hypothetical protein BZG36_01327 [Bifiguratus adelaidae]
MLALGYVCRSCLHGALRTGGSRLRGSGRRFVSAAVRQIQRPDRKSSSSSLAQYNKHLGLLRRKPGVAGEDLLQQTLKECTSIKRAGLQPDLSTYESLIAIFCKVGSVREGMKTLEEMLQFSIEPSVSIFDTLLRAAASQDMMNEYNQLLLLLQTNCQSKITPAIYQHIIQVMCQHGDYERALNTLHAAIDQGIIPTLATFVQVIRASIDNMEHKEAYALLLKAEKLVDLSEYPKIYLECLRSAADDLSHEATQSCWKQTVTVYQIEPDEGTCMKVLHVAGQNGDVELANAVIDYYVTNGFDVGEPHFAPLLQAYAKSGQIKSAFELLAFMREKGVPPLKETAVPIYHQIRNDPSAIDGAFRILEELHRDGKDVDVTALNIIIHACAKAGDVQKAMEVYHGARDIGVIPNRDTYNSVLDACIAAKQPYEAKVIIDDMHSAGVSPDVVTYGKMVVVECTRSDYENAFNYLSEMKRRRMANASMMSKDSVEAQIGALSLHSGDAANGATTTKDELSKETALHSKRGKTKSSNGATRARPSLELVKERIKCLGKNPEQSILNVIKLACYSTLSSPSYETTLQSIKAAFYQRDYLSIFSNPSNLPVYTAAYIPGRALCYYHIFKDEPNLRRLLAGQTRIFLPGSGSGSELIGISAAMLWASSPDQQISLHMQDIGEWDGVLQDLEKAARSSWNLQDQITCTFEQGDILEPTDQRKSEIQQAKMITFMFVLNELFKDKSRAIRLIQDVIKDMARGSYLLVVDSAGSFSHLQIGGKQYMVYFLLDALKELETVVSYDAKWYRFPDDLTYPVDLQNMRYFLRLYRKM